MSQFGVFLGTVLLAQGIGGAPPQTPQPFPVGPDTAEGAAAVEGVVTRLGTGEPIPLATVVLTPARNLGNINSLNSLADLAAGGPPASAPTDAGGRFVLEGVAPGDYRITAFRNGFVRQDHGANEPGVPGPPVELRAGETFEAELQMTPAAVIAGRIFDERGEPVPDIQVSALQPGLVSPDGQQGLRPVAGASTDDRGEYRLFWLDPGEYVVSASTSTGSFLSSLTLATGGSGRSPNVAPRSEQMAAFYPGVPDEALAAPIRVGAGDERGGVDIRLAVRRTFAVSGRVVNPSPLGGFSMVSLRPATLSFSALSDLFSSTPVDSQGNFTIRDVEPGTYTVQVRAQGIGGRELTASTSVEVTDRDVENVTLALTPGIDIAVNAFVEDAATPSASEAASEFDWSQVRIALRSDDILGSANGQPSDTQGGYLLENVAPGDYTVNVTLLPNSGLYLKRILLGSEEIAPDDTITIEPGFTGPLFVLISPNGGRIEGVASRPDGEPAADAAITLLPLNMTGASAGGAPFGPRNLTQADRTGNYSLAGIAPGEYRLFAWATTDSVPFGNEEFVRRFAARGERVVVREGDTLTLNLDAITDSDIE